MLHHQSIGSGPPVLLLPGMLGTIESEWQNLIQPIADLGYKVIAADLPGHGQSEMTKSLTMRVMIEEIDRLLTGIHCDPVIILGYSLGGYAGLSYTLRNANRVVGLWMHGTKFYWSGEEAENLAAELDASYLEENKPEKLAQMRELHGEEKLNAMLPWLNKVISAMPDSGLTEMELEDLETPVMVSAGDRDELVPVSEAVDLYKALRRGQLSVFADTFHPMASVRDHVFIPAFRDFVNRLD
ncbi:alpha/beta fold hydrolase [candidate division KSB1 bacterium]|nr:MAG: alpha/beta fold hydrolase [candidate division KSB1 bacterium]